MSEQEVKPPAPTPLSQPARLTLCLAGLCAAVHPAHPPTASLRKWHNTNSLAWLKAVCKIADIDTSMLPGEIDVEETKKTASDQIGSLTVAERKRIGVILVEASLAVEADKAKANKEEALRYTPLCRSLSHRTLEILGLDPKLSLPESEKTLGNTLFAALKAATGGGAAEVESLRASKSEGWGGSLGRKLATGAGVIAGGVLIGVTGGLAAPAIAALLAPLGIGGLLAGGAAPVLLGTLFGVGGGGLAGKRVRERWKGVEEFSFLEVGAGTKATKEEMEELKAAKERYKSREKVDKTVDEDKEEKTEKEVEKEVEQNREELEEKLINLSIEAAGKTSESPRTSTESIRPSLESLPEAKEAHEVKKPPSLTATIVVTGLLSVSATEAITAWRAICSDQALDSDHSGLKDGRDVYYLRYETAMMLKTGRAIDSWVTSKIKGKIKGEIIKRTVLNAYFAAVKLPLTVYGVASMGLDNTWMQAVDRANKAGRILGEVLEKRVQGERPVILIGSSLGALTILKALLYLASLSPPAGVGLTSSPPQYVESAFLISLPSAPTPEEWQKCRGVVARRLVNAYSGDDWVLASVVRLHEVLARAATLNSGLSPAGLAPVEEAGIENIDIGEILKGHLQLNAKMGEIVKIINVDA